MCRAELRFQNPDFCRWCILVSEHFCREFEFQFPWGKKVFSSLSFHKGPFPLRKERELNLLVMKKARSQMISFLSSSLGIGTPALPAIPLRRGNVKTVGKSWFPQKCSHLLNSFIFTMNWGNLGESLGATSMTSQGNTLFYLRLFKRSQPGIQGARWLTT